MHDEMIIVSPLSFSNKTAVSAFAGVLFFWSVTSSTPSISPLPLTSPMTEKLYNNYENNNKNCSNLRNSFCYDAGTCCDYNIS